MRRVEKRFIVICTALTSLVGLWLMNMLIMGQVASASPPLQIPQITPVETAVFTATVNVAADQYAILVDDTLTVTVDLEVSEGCGYGVFNLTLHQVQEENAILEHIAPPTDTIIGPPVSMPSVWTFRATQPGTATLVALVFGEAYCVGGPFYWHYLSGVSEPIHVFSWAYSAWIPAISK